MFYYYKKIILSITIIAGMFLFSNHSDLNAKGKTIISIVDDDDDGFIEVNLQDLNEKVQASIKRLTKEFDVKTVKYSTEKKLTKVVLINKEDKTTKKVLFNDEGEKVEKDKDANKKIEVENKEIQLPIW